MEIHSGRLISILYRKSQAYLGQALKEFGIGSGEYPILLFLCKNDGITQEDLADYYCMDKSAITRVIQSLQEKEMIVRDKDAQDRRCNRIHLTHRGRASEAAIRSVLDKWNQVMTAGMKDEEIKELNRLLMLMVDNCR